MFSIRATGIRLGVGIGIRPPLGKPTPVHPRPTPVPTTTLTAEGTGKQAAMGRERGGEEVLATPLSARGLLRLASNEFQGNFTGNTARARVAGARRTDIGQRWPHRHLATRSVWITRVEDGLAIPPVCAAWGPNLPPGLEQGGLLAGVEVEKQKRKQ